MKNLQNIPSLKLDNFHHLSTILIDMFLIIELELHDMLYSPFFKENI